MVDLPAAPEGKPGGDEHQDRSKRIHGDYLIQEQSASFNSQESALPYAQLRGRQAQIKNSLTRFDPAAARCLS